MEEISIAELKKRIENNEDFILLDVRTKERRQGI